jgi:natural product biosynthesis luciferase-like monooxygenase protein
MDFETVRRSTAVFVGETSLLVRCAEIAQAAHFDVIAVVSKNSRIRQWATDNKIALHATTDGLAGMAPLYLFSVGNLKKLPPHVLQIAHGMSFNFHDGPLPGYAGLNVPTWALLAGEKHHAITWHEMTTTIDAGRIAVERSFAIADDETVRTLNAKCFDAGAQAFTELIDRLTHGTVQLLPQSGTGAYFGATHRPPNASWLDPQQPAIELVRLVRSLDFGGHENPLGRPWFCVGQQRYSADHAKVVDPQQASTRGTIVSGTIVSGTIVKTDGDGLEIATSSGVLHVFGIRDATGALIKPSERIQPGSRTDIPPYLNDLIARDAAIAKSEPVWIERLRSVSIPETSYPQHRHQTLTDRHALTLAPPKNTPAEVLVAGFVGWLAIQAGSTSVSFRLRTGARTFDFGDASALDRVVTLPTDATTTADNFVALTHAAIAATKALGPMARDVAQRRSSLDVRLPDPAELNMLVVLGGDDPIELGVDAALVLDPQTAGVSLSVDGRRYTHQTATRMAADLEAIIHALVTWPSKSLKDIALIRGDDAATATVTCPVNTESLGEAFARAAQQWPDRVAVRHRAVSVTYRELQQRVASVVQKLTELGPVHGKTIGIAMARGIDMLTAMLAAATAGATYLPLDPDFPADRVRFMIDDASVALLVSDGTSTWIDDVGPLVIEIRDVVAAQSYIEPAQVQPSDAAYMLYTSGSTGRPKGVVVTSANLASFLAGMDDRLGAAEPCIWLAVTSISFDISILELLWTVTRGGTVVLPSYHGHTRVMPASTKGPSLSLFYFASAASDETNPYRLLMEGAAFADAHDFEAVWTPERHFHAFGGTYPNAALTSAVLAGCTRRIALRAGSCVAPLHHPARIAEDWALVDRLSGGRAGIAFASGWSERDFVLAPGRYAERKQTMFDTLDQVRRLWRGDAVAFPGPRGEPIAVTTSPKPLRGEVPIWLTAAKSPETFEAAGQLGCNVLTHLLGMTFEEITENVRRYRAARALAGHAGPGRVTLMLHTFVGATDEEARAQVREPMKRYLESSIDLIWKAAGHFPTLKPGPAGLEEDFRALSADERDSLLEHAFNRYYATSGLFGAPDTCRKILQAAQRAGADEIACLIDFGVPVDSVLESLPRLASLRDASRPEAAKSAPLPPTMGLAEDMAKFGVTHLQCTPSLASMLLDEPSTRSALSQLSIMMVGGEEMTPDLARGLRAAVKGRVMNMYGPTETTIWSLTHDVVEVGDSVSLGLPIANTTIRIENPWGQALPPLMAGELLIGGDGVAAGYHNRPELTAERFVVRPTSPEQRFYRTGDLVRQQQDGSIIFLGRADHQVKIRGHRIELGEIEATLREIAGIKDAIVVAAGPPDKLVLCAFFTARLPNSVPPTDDIKIVLAARLPDVMVPSRIMLLDRMPMTPNQKIDRPALVAKAGTTTGTGIGADTVTADNSRTISSPLTLDQSAEEKTVREAWLEVLGIESVGLDCNFFDSGGHSLLAIRLRKTLSEKFARDIDLVDLFRFPTIRQFAAHVGGATPAANTVGIDRAAARRVRSMRNLDLRTNKMEGAQ